jgi:hypothetical protein
MPDDDLEPLLRNGAVSLRAADKFGFELPSGAEASLQQATPPQPVQDVMAGVADPLLKAGNYLGGIMQGSQQFTWPETIQRASELGMAVMGPKGERLATGVERGLAKGASMTLQDFLSAAKSGSIRKAAGPIEDLNNILSKKVPAVDFDINQGHPLSSRYESGKLTSDLQKKGLFVDDDMMGKVYVGTSPENLQAIKSAKTPFDYGRAYGYSDNDIAAFYHTRYGGDLNVALNKFLKDAAGSQ